MEEYASQSHPEKMTDENIKNSAINFANSTVYPDMGLMEILVNFYMEGAKAARDNKIPISLKLKPNNR